MLKIGNLLPHNPFRGDFFGDSNSITIDNFFSSPNSGLFGYLLEGKIHQLHIKGIAKGTERFGGIIGRANYSTILFCDNFASVGGTGQIGGIVGLSSGMSEISYCSNYGSVTGSSHFVGGIIGRDSNA